MGRYFWVEQQYRSFSLRISQLFIWICVVCGSLILFLFICNFSSNHNVHLKTTADFSAGQRILVQGKLRSTYVPMENGKKITRSIVKAFQLYVFENECASAESSQGDQNHVELLANIASNITEKDFLSTFAVATNYEIR